MSTTLLQEVVRFLPPSLAAIAVLVSGLHLLPQIKPYSRARMTAARAVGVLFPAFWLAAVGPEGLIKEGGFFMRILEVRPSFMNVTYFGLVWLGLYILCAVCLREKRLRSGFYQYLVYGFGYACITAALGVFVFLAYGRAANPS